MLFVSEMDTVGIVQRLLSPVLGFVSRATRVRGPSAKGANKGNDVT